MSFNFQFSQKNSFFGFQNNENVNPNNNIINSVKSYIPFFNFNKAEPERITIIGNLPQYASNNPKANLGSGEAKSVKLSTVLKNSLVKNSQKMGWKDVADSTQSGNKIGQEVELAILKILANDVRSKNYTPKVYYAGMHGNQLVTASKVISGGDARHCLPYMSIGDRLRTIVHYGKGLLFLHSKNIIHNDIALRNMLIKWPVERVSIEEALNCRLARPIFDQTGKTIIESKVRITPEIQNTIKYLNISHVKVFSSQPPEGIVTDFDRCTFLGNMKSNVLFGCAIDCTAPERKLASDQYKMVKESVNVSTEALQQAKEKFLLVSTPKSDAFSFGQLLCDAILRPDLNTNLSEKGEYNNVCQSRIDGRMKQYEEKSATSAMDPIDYQELFKIDPKLAEVAFQLMHYDPSTRLTIDEAILTLKGVIKTFPERKVSGQFYDTVFKTCDEAKVDVPSKGAFGLFASFSNNPVQMPVKIAGYGYDD